ncbi:MULTISPECIES: hypothetical protein [unclassified Nocardioides]|uniref:hypothetical protein n=1 Tax=unclassified Nocardioides TaxID=2615069 RepID=UPI0036197D89
MAEVTWNCAACGFPIADGDGWVQARMSEVNQREIDVAEWESEHTKDDGPTALTYSELMDAPGPVPWTALHEVCDGTAGEPYAIDVEELRTPWDLIRWTADLMQKSWLKATDWSEVIRAKHTEHSPE